MARSWGSPPDADAIIRALIATGLASRLRRGTRWWSFNIATHTAMHEFVPLRWADARRIAGGDSWEMVLLGKANSRKNRLNDKSLP